MDSRRARGFDTAGRPITERTPRSREAAHKCAHCGGREWVDDGGLVNHEVPAWKRSSRAVLENERPTVNRIADHMWRHLLGMDRHRMERPTLPPARVAGLLRELQAATGRVIELAERLEAATRAGRVDDEDLDIARIESVAGELDGLTADLRERWGVDC